MEEEEEVEELLPEEEEEGPVAGLFRNQRIAKKPTRATAMICGMLTEVWLVGLVSAMMTASRGWVCAGGRDGMGWRFFRI